VRPEIDIVDGLIWYFVFLYSTIIHEAGHAWAALKLGDDTAYRGGQVSLDPMPHIVREPFGMVIVPILSYFLRGWMIGWASAPYDPGWAQRHPRRAAWMALAGPAADLLVLVAAAIVIRAGLAYHLFRLPTGDDVSFFSLIEGNESRLWDFCAALLSVTFWLNLLYFVFNLLPLPPLDGCCLPLLFLSPSAADKYQSFMWNPSMRLFGLIVAWQLFGTLFPPIASVALQLIYRGLPA
jgi:Zn-dependent protease